MAEETGTEPFERLSADPRFQNFAKQADEMFNTTLSQEIANSKNFAGNVSQQKAQVAEALVPKGVPSNFKTQSYLGGNYLTGPNPGGSDPKISSKDYVNEINNYMANPDAWKTKGSEYAKPYSYNAGVNNTNFDRYYNHPNFQKLGWTPFRDNETLYNQNSSWWDDFNRMRSQFLGLAGQGFKSMYGWTAGDSQKFDRELADEFSKRMGIMNSSKGGFGGGLINFAGNAAYTVGIMSSFVLEEAAMLAGTVLSGGLLSEVTVPAMAASAARAGRGLFQAARTAEKVAEGIKTTEQMAQGINNMQKARDLWEYAKGIKKVLPLNTLGYLDETGKVLKSADEINFTKLKDFAFLAKGPAALYRDFRELNAVMSESRLEGGMVRNDLTQELVNENFLKTGLAPTDEEAQKIYAAANEAGIKTTLYNLPAIYLSNKLVFGKMLRGWKPASVNLADISKGISGTLVTEGGKAQILKGASKFTKAAYWKQSPSRLIAGTLRYGKANFAEGAQEVMQEVISSGAKDYYKRIYSDPNLAGNRQFWGSFQEGIEDQSNGKGLEVFLSGFFMGGLVQGPQHLIFNTLNEKWTKYTSPEQFKKQKEAREKWENSVVNSYNAVTGKGVVPFFNAIEENMSSQVHLESLMNEAEQVGDRKQAVDVTDESLFTQLTTLLKNGSYEHFIEQLESMKKMTPEELGEAFNQSPEGDVNNKSLPERVDSVIGRAQQIRKRYEAVNERFVNPFNPSKYSRKTQINEFLNESLDHHAFEEAKKHAIFADYAFDRATERMSSLLNNIAGANQPLAKASSDDITSIFNPAQFQSKLDVLKKEIEVYGTGASTPEQKQLASKLRVKRDSLIKLGTAIGRYTNAIDKVKSNQEIDTDIIQELNDAYTNHIKVLGAEVNETVLNKNITPSFQALMDYIELDHDAKSYAGVINFLHDPDNFRSFNKNIREALATEQAQKDDNLRAGLKEATDRKDKTELMNALFDKGIWIDDSDVEALKAGKFDQVEFYSITPLGKIEKTSERYINDILPLLNAYNLVSGKAPEATDTVAGTTEVDNAAQEAILAEISKQRDKNTQTINKRIQLLKTKADLLGKNITSTTDTLEYLDKLLQNAEDLTSDDVQYILDQIETLSQLTRSRTSQKTKRGVDIAGAKAELRSQVRKEFQVLTDISTRIRTLKEELEQMKSIKQDLVNQVNYYNNLLANPAMKTLDKAEITNQIDKVEKKISRLEKLIDAVKKAIERTLAYIKEYVSVTLSRIKTFENFKKKKGIVVTGTADGVRTLIDSNTDQSYQELYSTYNQLERNVLDSINDTEFLETVKGKEAERLEQLNARLSVYHNQLRYLNDLLVPSEEPLTDAAVSKPPAAPKPPAPAQTNKAEAVAKTEEQIVKQQAKKEEVTPKAAAAAEAQPVATEKAPEKVTPGQVIYATLGAGKTTLAASRPDKYLDGDEILFNHLKTMAQEYNEGGQEVIKVPETAQEAGSEFFKFINTQTPEDKHTHIAEIQQIFKDLAASGKTVLTSNWFARDIADKIYLIKDLATIMSELRDRGRTENIKTEAQKLLDKEEAWFINKPTEVIPPGVTIEAILEKNQPTVAQGRVLMTEKVNNLKTMDDINLFKANIAKKLIEDDEYLERYGFDGESIWKLITQREEEITKNVTFDNVAKGNYILMTDGSLVQVLVKHKDKTLTVKYQGDSKESTMTEADLKNATKIVTKENMKEAVKPTKQETEAAAENMKNQKEFLSDPDARKKAVAEAQNKTKDQADEDLLNSICI